MDNRCINLLIALLFIFDIMSICTLRRGLFGVYMYGNQIFVDDGFGNYYEVDLATSLFSMRNYYA